MNVGDLVIFRRCGYAGKTGIITMLTEPSHIAKSNPNLQLYWVAFEEGIQCFTGSQLILSE